MPKRYYKFEEELISLGRCMLVFVVILLVAGTILYGHYAP